MTSTLELAWRLYLGQLRQRPLRTKAITAACIGGLSDVIAQHIIQGRYTSWRRTLCLAAFGGLWSGPSAHFWQRYLEKLFKGKSDIVTVLRKVVLDQGTYGPLCNVLFMSFASLVFDGMSVAQLGAKLVRDYPRVQLNGWKVWPLAALVNYRFVPVQFRVLVVNCVALCWSIFLLLSGKRAAAAAAAAAAAKRN